MTTLLLLVPAWMLLLVCVAIRTISYLHYDNLQIDAEPELLERLKALSAQTGLIFHSPRLGPGARLSAQALTLSGRLQGCPATWALVVGLENGNLMIEELRVVLQPEHHLGFDLKALPLAAASTRSSFKNKDRRDLLTGDGEFDAKFSLSTRSPEQVARLLTYDVRKNLLDLEAEPDSRVELTHQALTFAKALRGRLTSETIAETFETVDTVMKELIPLAEALHDALSEMENRVGDAPGEDTHAVAHCEVMEIVR